MGSRRLGPCTEIVAEDHDNIVIVIVIVIQERNCLHLVKHFQPYVILGGA